MKRILIILSILGLSVSVKSQTEGTQITQAIPSAGTWYAFFPVGWSTAPANKRIMRFHEPGSGATTLSALNGEYPFKKYIDGWNGKKILGPGDTVYYALISTTIGNVSCGSVYRAFNYAFANWIPSTDTATIINLNHVVLTGYSAGGGEMSKHLSGFCFDGTGDNWYINVIRRCHKFGTAATGSWQNLSKLDTLGGKCFYWGFVDPADGLYNNTVDVYNAFRSNPKSSGYSVKKTEISGPGHTGIDDYMDQDGTTANNDFSLWVYDTAYGLNLNCRYNMNRYYDYRKTRNYSGGGYADSLLYTNGYDPEFGTAPTPSGTSIVPGLKVFYQQAAEVPGSWEAAYDFRGTWTLNKAWYYVGGASTNPSDSFFIYTGNDSSGWTRLHKEVVNYAASGWFSITFPANTTIKELKILVHGTWNQGQGSVNNCAIKRIIFYGCPAGAVDSSQITDYTGIRRRVTYGNYIGINNKLGYDPWQNFRGYKHIRTQQFNNWFDDETTYHTPDNVIFNPDHFDEYDGDRKRSERVMLDSAKRLGFTTYTTQVGAGQWYTNASGVFEGWYLDTLGLNPYDINSHDRAKRLFYTKAALYGTVAVDTNQIKMTGMPKFSGDASLLWMGGENEAGGENATWKACDTCSGTKRYLPPRHLAVADQAKYAGIRMADPSGAVHYVMPTWSNLDTASTKTLVAYSQKTRPDGRNIYDAFSFNNYNVVGNKTQHPVEYNLYGKAKAAVNFSYRINPNLQIWATENGVGRNSQDIFSSPLPAGKDSGQWQADQTDYMVLDYLAAGFDRFYIYDAIGDRADNDLTASIAESDGGNFKTHHFWYIARASASLPAIYFPAFWVGNQRMNLLRNYYVDTVLAYNWQGVTAYKLRNINYPDSVIIAVGRPSYTSATQIYNIPVGSTNGNVTKIVMSYNSDTPTTSTLVPAVGVVSETIGPRIQWYQYREAGAVNSQIKGIKLRRVKVG